MISFSAWDKKGKTTPRTDSTSKMVVFQCECCGDSVKKPKAEQHAQVCRGWRGYVCLDCMKLFKVRSQNPPSFSHGAPTFFARTPPGRHVQITHELHQRGPEVPGSSLPCPEAKVPTTRKVTFPGPG